MIAQDQCLVIARVQLSRHPDTPATYNDEHDQYLIDCEVAPITFVRQNLPEVKIPGLYTYEAAGSSYASSAGTAYMLLEGFYGNTLQDVKFDICDLPASGLQYGGVSFTWPQTSDV